MSKLGLLFFLFFFYICFCSLGIFVGFCAPSIMEWYTCPIPPFTDTSVHRMRMNCFERHHHQAVDPSRSDHSLSFKDPWVCCRWCATTLCRRHDARGTLVGTLYLGTRPDTRPLALNLQWGSSKYVHTLVTIAQWRTPMLEI